jgi:cytidyltransferase-like protein
MNMVKVFVSGCYDILHAGHLQFFQEARSLGDYLIVCFASDEVLYKHKKRKSSIPQDHKQVLLNSIRIIDEVVVGTGTDLGIDFKQHLIDKRPNILAVTEDDMFKVEKETLCKELGIQYVVLSKSPPDFTPVSTSSIINTIRAPFSLPLRVDFGGGWLDVPKFSSEGAFIVNCAISPIVTLKDWCYNIKSGLGGSGAWAMLNGSDGIQSELNLGVGWQDPAVIQETGLCVWRSGYRPVLELKRNGDFLNGLMALSYTGVQHDTPMNANNIRDFELIKKAGHEAYLGALNTCIEKIAAGIDLSYAAQLKEGMEPLLRVEHSIARKYCGGGWGGYALYLFKDKRHRDEFVSSNKSNLAIEPFLK